MKLSLSEIAHIALKHMDTLFPFFVLTVVFYVILALDIFRAVIYEHCGIDYSRKHGSRTYQKIQPLCLDGSSINCVCNHDHWLYNTRLVCFIILQSSCPLLIRLKVS